MGTVGWECHKIWFGMLECQKLEWEGFGLLDSDVL